MTKEAAWVLAGAGMAIGGAAFGDGPLGFFGGLILGLAFFAGGDDR